MGTSEASARDSILGRMIGNYRVERKVGSGGMGSVYLLRHIELNTLAALKVLAPEFGQELRDRFHQEARAAAAIGSHRVVHPWDIGQFPDGVQYIVMDYVDGRSLADELRARGPLPVVVALKTAYRIADTMMEAHAKGIVHRDLKPQNIMLTCEGGKQHVVKLLDFGVARAGGELKLVQTGSRMIIGTPGYMSPEAATGLGADGRTDVFSLGVILFEMLTGELPFPLPRGSDDSDSFQSSVVTLLTSAAPRPSARRPRHLERASSAVDAVVAQALVKEPAARPTMAAFQLTLGNLLAQHEGREPTGQVQHAMATMLSTSAPDEREFAPHEAPTLSTPSGEVARLLERLATPDPARVTAPGRFAAARPRAAGWRPIAIGALVGVLAAAGAALSAWVLWRHSPPSAAVAAPPPAPAVAAAPPVVAPPAPAPVPKKPPARRRRVPVKPPEPEPVHAAPADPFEER